MWGRVGVQERSQERTLWCEIDHESCRAVEVCCENDEQVAADAVEEISRA